MILTPAVKKNTWYSHRT